MKQRVTRLLRAPGSIGTLAAMGIKGLGVLISVLMVPATLGYLQDYEYGVWLTLYSILTWINFFDFGMGVGLRNKLTEALAVGDSTAARRYVSSAFVMIGSVAAVCALIVIALAFALDWYTMLNIAIGVADLKLTIAVVGVALCANFALRTVGMVYLSMQKVWASELLPFLGALIAYAGVLMLPWVSKGSLLLVASVISLSPLLVYGIAIAYTFGLRHRELAPAWRLASRSDFASIGSLGMQFFLFQIASMSVMTYSNIVISREFSPSEVTPYGIAFKYFNILVLFFTIATARLWTAITSSNSVGDSEGERRSMRTMMRLGVLFMSGGVVMVCVSQPVFELWIRGEVEIGYPICISLAVFNACFIFSTVYTTWCSAVSRMRVAVASMCAGAVAFIPLSQWFSHAMGLPGIGYAMGTAFLIPALSCMLQYHKSVLRNSRR